MRDTFFSSTRCGRCGADLKGGFTMSWFVEIAICSQCSDKERIIKNYFRSRGEWDHEGCGYIPSVPIEITTKEAKR